MVGFLPLLWCVRQFKVKFEVGRCGGAGISCGHGGLADRIHRGGGNIWAQARGYHVASSADLQVEQTPRAGSAGALTRKAE